MQDTILIGFYCMRGKCVKNHCKRFLIGKIESGFGHSHINRCSHYGYKLMNFEELIGQLYIVE